MKKLILSIVVATFAVAVQAGNDGTCSEKGGSCCPTMKASTATKGECPMMKQAKAGKGSKQASVKQPLKSPKATS